MVPYIRRTSRGLTGTRAPSSKGQLPTRDSKQAWDASTSTADSDTVQKRSCWFVGKAGVGEGEREEGGWSSSSHGFFAGGRIGGQVWKKEELEMITRPRIPAKGVKLGRYRIGLVRFFWKKYRFICQKFLSKVNF